MMVGWQVPVLLRACMSIGQLSKKGGFRRAVSGGLGSLDAYARCEGKPLYAWEHSTRLERGRQGAHKSYHEPFGTRL